MTRAIYIIGNDGSGKTTYSRRLEERLRKRGYSAARQHYYRQRVRRAFRCSVERLARVSKRKTSNGGDVCVNVPSPGRSMQTGNSLAREARDRLLIAILYVYQLAMALEMQLKVLVSRVDFLVLDRSYIDDLASILGSFRLSTPPRLIRFSASLFPQWNIIYVYAGHEIEYARIQDVDLSKRSHREKSQRYEEMVKILVSAGAPLRRVDTGPKSPLLQVRMSGETT